MILLVEGRALALTGLRKNIDDSDIIQHESSQVYRKQNDFQTIRPLSMSCIWAPLDTHILNKRKESQLNGWLNDWLKGAVDGNYRVEIYIHFIRPNPEQLWKM
jgi:hypothetical protein